MEEEKVEKKSKKKIIIISIIAIIAVVIVVSIVLIKMNKKEEGPTKLSFKESVSIDTINSLNGKKVTMTGYMSTLSPLDGKFVYLMNLPYQSCPFCVPNTTILANTLAVYSKSGSQFEFTDNPVTIEGTLVTGDFTDEFGYNYQYKIEDATLKEADVDELSENIKIYSAISQDGLLQNILSLVMHTDANIYYDEYGYSTEQLVGVNIEDIDNCINKLLAISKTDYSDLIEDLKILKEINEISNKNINDKNYTANATEKQRMEEVYMAVNNWINKYEL